MGADSRIIFATNPIVVGDMMFVTDPGKYMSLNQNVVALDASTGEPLWRRSLGIEASPEGLGLQSIRNNRGVAFGEGKVYVATLDAHLWALDARTGEPVESFGDGTGSIRVADINAGYFLTMAPLFIPRALVPQDGPASGRDLVILGISGAGNETRGFVTAYDANTGEIVWRFFTIPEPKEFGGDTWPNIIGGPFSDPFSRGGGAVWMIPSFDPTSGLLIFGVANPGPDVDGTHRAGTNLFSDSVTAVRVADGQRVWHFQEVHHDLWDYDQSAPIVLFTMPKGKDGERVKAVGAAGKTGWFYMLDRQRGEPLFPCPEKLVTVNTAVTAPDGSPEMPYPTQPMCESDAFVPHGNRLLPSGRFAQPIFTPPGPPSDSLMAPPFLPFLPPVPVSDVVVEPGASGGSEWSPVSYNPQLGLAFIAGNVFPMTYTTVPEEAPTPGRMATGGHWSFTDEDLFVDGSGLLTAMDVATGKIRWQQPTESPLFGGSCATAGGLVFMGEGERNPDDPSAPLWFFTAFDAATGERLFRFRIPGDVGVNAPCVSYEVGGEQFIAVAVGGATRPQGGHSDTIYAFALPNQ